MPGLALPILGEKRPEKTRGGDDHRFRRGTMAFGSRALVNDWAERTLIYGYGAK